MRFKLFRKKNKFGLTIKRIIGFYPNRLPLYQQAFTHKSVIQHPGSFESNERLEFLGDAILDSIIAHHLFTKFPSRDEGFLTQLKAKLVSRKMLNNLGLKLGLEELVRTKNNTSDSTYGNALEALIGAIYLDSGYKVTERFVLKKLIEGHIDIDDLMQTETDFKSRIIEWAQKEKRRLEFVLSEKEVKDNRVYTAKLLIEDEHQGEGVAFSKKKAEQLASEQFYKRIYPH